MGQADQSDGEWFVDTAGWGSYFDDGDPFHEQAKELVHLAVEAGTGVGDNRLGSG